MTITVKSLDVYLLGPEFSSEAEIQWNGITAHPDTIWKPGGIPTAIIEIKTTNSAGVSRKPYESHIRQLKSYISIIEGVSYGKIFYMYLGTNLDKVFYEYTITMTEEERKEIQDTLIADASELRLGINMKDPSLVPHIANDSCQTFEGVWHPPSKGQSHNQSTGGWSFLIRTCICDIEIEPSLLPL